MTTPTPPRDVLLPCPFCGGEPTTSKRMDEDLWTHNIVEWRGVRCTDCDIGFDWPPGSEVSAAEQWNRRADRIERALAVQGEAERDAVSSIDYWQQRGHICKTCGGHGVIRGGSPLHHLGTWADKCSDCDGADIWDARTQEKPK